MTFRKCRPSSTTQPRRRERRFPATSIPASRLECDRADVTWRSIRHRRRAGLANNYTGVRERTQDSQTADFRIDQILNQNNRLFARYSFNGVDTFTPPVFSGG